MTTTAPPRQQSFDALIERPRVEKPPRDVDERVKKAAGQRRKATIDERFRKFDAEYPMVYRKLVEYAMSARNAGRGRFGISMLWERLRWYVRFEVPVEDAAGFKLNNDFRSRYARKLMAEFPSLVGFFETRELRTD